MTPPHDGGSLSATGCPRRSHRPDSGDAVSVWLRWRFLRKVRRAAAGHCQSANAARARPLPRPRSLRHVDRPDFRRARLVPGPRGTRRRRRPGKRRAFATFGAASGYCRSKGWVDPVAPDSASDGAHFAAKVSAAAGASDDRPLTLAAVTLCGAVSGPFTCLILTPAEYVKCRVQTRVDPTIAQCLRAVWQSPTETAGSPKVIVVLRRVYSGFLPTMGREVCGNAAWFATFHAASAWLQPDEARRVLWQNALSGAAAGVMYWSVLYPADTIKTRMQTAQWQTSAQALPTTSAWAIGRGHRQRGRRAGTVRRGWTTTVVRAAPANAVVFSVYAAYEKWLCMS